MSDSPQQKKTVKVGILGDKYVGKTYLTHKITGLNYQGYKETTSISQLKSQDPEQTAKFIYIDNPALDNQSIVNIGSVYQYDILVFLFKDCDSFTKLFDFFDTIKQTLNSQQNHHVKQYWTHPKKIIVVYSNFQSIIEVQLQQLFTILVQQTSLFCNQTIFESFILENQCKNWKDLKFLIQKPPVIIFTNQKVSQMSSEAKNPTLQKQESQKQIQASKQIEQLKKQQVQQQEERAELLSEQKSEVVVINTQPEQIKNLEVGEITKQIETASAQMIPQEEKSKQQIKPDNLKQDQNYVKVQNVSKTGQVEQNRTTNNQYSLFQVINTLNPTQQVKINTSQHKMQHLVQGIIKKQDQRKQEIMKKIRDSFCGQFLHTYQNRNSKFDQEQHINKTEEVNIQGKKQDLFINFKKPENQHDQKISLQLNNQNEQKNQQLHNLIQTSEKSENQVKKQQSRQSLNKQPEQSEVKVQISNVTKEIKQQPQSQFSKFKKVQKQKKNSQEPKNCKCQII